MVDLLDTRPYTVSIIKQRGQYELQTLPNTLNRSRA